MQKNTSVCCDLRSHGVAARAVDCESHYHGAPAVRFSRRSAAGAVVRVLSSVSRLVLVCFLYISYFFLFNQIVIEYAVYRFLNSLILFFSVVLSSVCPCAISLRVCNVLSARHIWTAPAAVNVATMVFGSGNKFRIKRYASHLSDSTFLFFSG